MSNIAKMIAIAKRFGGGSGTSEVVILPETVAERFENDGVVGFILHTPFINNPEFDKTYTVTCNGDVYECKSFDAFHEGPEPIVIGNAGLMGVESTTNEPFLILLYPSGNYQLPNGTTGYGAIMMNPVPESVTLSIVEKAETASAGGGGVCMVNVSCETTDGETFTNATKDKSYAEMKAAYDAGAFLHCRLSVVGQEDKLESPLFMTTAGGFMFGPSIMPNILVLVNPDDTVIVAKD